MKPEFKSLIETVKTKGWKKIRIEFGHDYLEIEVPPDCQELSMKEIPPATHPGQAVEEALSHPIGTPRLEEIIQRKNRTAGNLSVAIVVSDITRPVPYQGESGLLPPLLRQLRAAGILKENIKIIVATGLHRPTTAKEKLAMYGEEVVGNYQIIDHNADDPDLFLSLGLTSRKTPISINRHFYLADLKIVTGLVESHFFAGISGGRKAICPGLVNVKTIEKFHGPEYLENPLATNLILDGNPCHEEALEIAQKAGVDFALNVTLNKDLQMTGVFAGDLVESNLQAFQFIKDYVAIPLDREYDVVLTHGGYVGQNHYQTAKAAAGALPAAKKGGTIIIVANNSDPFDPVGSPEYRTFLHLLKLQGPDGYLDLIKSPGWKFTRDQWEPEVWGKVLRKVGEEGLIYCSPEINPKDYSLLPGRSGPELLEENNQLTLIEKAREMTQKAVLLAVARLQLKKLQLAMAFIREGPYAVPFRTSI
ncbi:MAG TPA: nickel-dependent lactate racemase [Candidatus Saccharicenans sp.]|nr:nickel-dependent lactate racemase [Candidatus Saccharicenans sp.]HNT00613.1 nickel-dependent lactate racemase [Candidatus Saccharicenans sp.]